MTTKVDPLDTELSELFPAVRSVQAQSIIREGVLSVGELERIRDEHYPGLALESDEFRRSFDFNGRLNLGELAKIRGVGWREVVLNMAVEVGLISEAHYRQRLRKLTTDSAPRRPVFLQYDAGTVYICGEKVGQIQERTPTTRMQIILQMFQDQNWPTSIGVPLGWDDEKVTNTCRALRNRFDGHLVFHEAGGGRQIRVEVVVPNGLVALPWS